MTREKGFDYFIAPANHFWKWSDGGKVIEWQNGKTICYTEDLTNIVRSLNGCGLPSISVMLLVLAACNKGWQNDLIFSEILRTVGHSVQFEYHLQQGDNPNYARLIEDSIPKALAGMIKIAELPTELRSGYRRAQLIKEITTDGFIEIQQDDVINIADTLSEFTIRTAILIKSNNKDKGVITHTQFLKDLKCLAQIVEKYPTAQAFEQKLRTGLDAIPLPAPLEMPEQKPAGDLLQELLEEPKTEHISRLAKKMIAALHIPMHFQRSGGQSYGGISDITNRGNFDKLLLSELANDDNMLMTRLVNNEALYLRREEPPHNPKTRRLILIDSTIKLWGNPRVFAISAAIACTQNLRQNETVEGYTLGGNDYIETDLATKKGILQSLEQLDAALHCSTALSNCIDEVASGANGDTIFITNAENITEPSFQKTLVAIGDNLDFIITINRNGELHFNSVSAGRMKQLSKAKIDLEEILAQKSQHKLPQKKKGKIDGLPAFLNMEKPPLLFPAVHVNKPSTDLHYYHSELGLLGITQDMRLLWWQSKNKGAKELIVNVKTGNEYRFLYDGANSVCLAVLNYNKTNLTIYYLYYLGDEMIEWDIEVKPIAMQTQCALKNNMLYINPLYFQSRDTANIAQIDCRTGRLKGYLLWNNCEHILQNFSLNLFNQASKRLSSIAGIKTSGFINNGYTVIIRVKRVYIDVQNSLCINDQYLEDGPERFTSQASIQLKDGADNVQKSANEKYEKQPLKENENLWLRQFRWADGSSAIVDSRGLLHLKSSNTLLPEVSFVLIQGQPTACWASDGALCGNDYFRESIVGMMPVQSFYKKYITPIIQTIIQKA